MTNDVEVLFINLISKAEGLTIWTIQFIQESAVVNQEETFAEEK